MTAALSRGRARVRRGVLAVGVLAALVGGFAVDRATGTDPSTCEVFTADSLARAELVTGTGAEVLVIGDSWSAGLGLDDIERSWPSRLPGQVRVAGFSGSGFSADASSCGRAVSFAARARRAVAQVSPDTPVVVEGGLNDWDQSGQSITRGFERLMRILDGHPVTVVGPAAAPARAAYVPRVEALLADLCEEYDATYVSTSDLRLTYLTDLLHLTPGGHVAFGDAVAGRIGSSTAS